MISRTSKYRISRSFFAVVVVVPMKENVFDALYIALAENAPASITKGVRLLMHTHCVSFTLVGNISIFDLASCCVLFFCSTE